MSVIAQAVKGYKNNCKQGTFCGLVIGFVLQDSQIPDYSDVHWSLYLYGRIAQDHIDLIPAYQNHPLVQQAVREIKQYLPELSKSVKTKREWNDKSCERDLN